MKILKITSKILISGVRDLYFMAFLDHSKHAFNKINYEMSRMNEKVW